MFSPRFQETSFKGPVASLLWSDPINPEEYPDMSLEDLETFFFRPNEGRGCVGWLFGHRATNSFLAKNKFITLIRGHEVNISSVKKKTKNKHLKTGPAIWNC